MSVFRAGRRARFIYTVLFRLCRKQTEAADEIGAERSGRAESWKFSGRRGGICHGRSGPVFHNFNRKVVSLVRRSEVPNGAGWTRRLSAARLIRNFHYTEICLCRSQEKNSPGINCSGNTRRCRASTRSTKREEFTLSLHLVTPVTTLLPNPAIGPDIVGKFLPSAIFGRSECVGRDRNVLSPRHCVRACED